jgi:hypothetical protein
MLDVGEGQPVAQNAPAADLVADAMASDALANLSDYDAVDDVS